MCVCVDGSSKTGTRLTNGGWAAGHAHVDHVPIGSGWWLSRRAWHGMGGFVRCGVVVEEEEQPNARVDAAEGHQRKRLNTYVGVVCILTCRLGWLRVLIRTGQWVPSQEGWRGLVGGGRWWWWIAGDM